VWIDLRSLHRAKRATGGLSGLSGIYKKERFASSANTKKEESEHGSLCGSGLKRHRKAVHVAHPEGRQKSSKGVATCTPRRSIPGSQKATKGGADASPRSASKGVEKRRALHSPTLNPWVTKSHSWTLPRRWDGGQQKAAKGSTHPLPLQR